MSGFAEPVVAQSCEVKLEAAEVRLTFQIALDECLRDLSDPIRAMEEASAILGRHLGVSQVGFGEIDDTQTHVSVHRDWNDGQIDSVVGTWCMDDFGPAFVAGMKTGKTIAISDVREDRLTPGPQVTEAFDAIRTRSLLDVPLVRDGRMVAMLFVHHAERRFWSSDDIAVTEATCARLWSAVERARAEARLRESNVMLAQNERMLDALIRSSSEVRYRINADWSMLYQLTGGNFLPDAATDDRGWLDSYIPAEDRDAVRAEIARVIGEKSTYLIEHRVNRLDGTVGWALSRAVPLLDEAGTITEWLGAASDITGRKEAEAALRESEARLRQLNDTLEQRVAEELAVRSRVEEQLRQAQKMEAVGQLTGGLAHDFNNLLTGITGSLELLQTRMAQGRIGDADRYINAAQGAARRAAALTHRLLAFSRRQTLDPRPTDVNRLVAGMQELIERTIGPGITMEPVVENGLWTTLVDPGQLENALLNLCINARDAMPDGGRLTVETGNRWLDERAARERGLPAGQYVTLCVSDNGIGMPPEVIARAFDPFFTTKPIGQGTGLGLSMIYGFAQQSGGQVRIHSEPGRGTTVCLYLRRQSGEADVAEAEARPDIAPRAGPGETVLVVDDEPTVRMLVAEVLGELGYRILVAADGAAGLQVLNSAERIDLLVTDVGLPGGMNGRQVADAGRIVRPELKVLFITGYAEKAVLSHGHLDPGMHVLIKPFAMEMLATRIKALITES